ncbi:hypothetical protein WMY93_029555 [Mugilogobius chulae]|uniref:SSD domain-containing protein n=1 Tax=Mugilogobius chulae TaxID=88201 RepID=A0AAW0MPM6_9GOBI
MDEEGFGLRAAHMSRRKDPPCLLQPLMLRSVPGRCSGRWERLEPRPRSSMLRQVLHAGLRTSFHALGRFVASHPVFFASGPVLLAILLGSSFSRYHVEEDVEGLLAPKHSLAKIEGNLVESLFPINRSKHALYSDLQTPGRYGRVIITTKKGSVLDPLHMDAILELHRRISQLQVTVPASGLNSFNYTFSYLCLLDDKNLCIIDDIIRAMEEIQSARSSNRTLPVLRYPITELADGRQAYIGHQLGGVANGGAARGPGAGLRGEGVRSAKALQLTYYLHQWEKAFCTELKQFADANPKLTLYPSTSSSLKTDFQFSSELARRPLLASLGVCGVLAVLCCSMRDCVRSKPWLGLLALLSITLSGLTAAGILNLTGATYNSTYLGIPFVMLGHGLFGSFEMLSSWRRTREDQHVKERVASVFEDIMLRFSGCTLIHLLTLGLAASPLTNMEAVRLFCRTATLAVAVSYIYTLSFYSSCLVFTGYLETGYRHGCFCRRVPKQDRLDSKPAWYRYLMFTRYQDDVQNPPISHNSNSNHVNSHPLTMNNPGGHSHAANSTHGPPNLAPSLDPHPQDSHLLLGCVRRCYGEWITNTYVKPFVVLLYLVYISFGLMGFLQVSQGSDPSALVAMDTATVLYTRAQQRYFSSYSPSSASTSTRARPTGTPPSNTTCWTYLNYLSERNESTSQPRENFTHTLRHYFLKEPEFAHFADDIIFAERGQGEEPDVAASRIFLAAKTTENKREEMSILLDTLRRLSLTSRVRFLIFNPSFVYLDRYSTAVSSPLRHSLLAVIFLLALSSLALVEPLVAVWLGLTILSVQFGVLGFMTLWGVEMDCMSILCLIAAMDTPLTVARLCCAVLPPGSAKAGLAGSESPWKDTASRVYKL